jgi:molecular chaperone GrpE
MNTDEAGGDRQSAGEQTAVLPETASQLVELERLQLALGEAEVADLDNVRKRAQKDIEAANRYGLEKFAAELLPVRDSLELAVQNAEKADVRSLKQGQDATLQLLTKALEKIGIVTINPVGEPFDPERHEAMLAQPSNTAEPNSVLQVVQPGYEINGRLLRPARVIVAKAP